MDVSLSGVREVFAAHRLVKAFGNDGCKCDPSSFADLSWKRW
jgi:hypothetical protein